ncbi:MAG: transketolase [Pseudomonadota bacterium]
MQFKVDINRESLTDPERKTLENMWRNCARRIILSTTLAGSGHPGGSLSSLGLLLMLYSIISHKPKDPDWPKRDRVLISMGHVSPGAYSVLSEFGYFPEDRFLLEFRSAGSPFSGHVEQCVPGVEWNTGNLGQGLSAATGMALAMKIKKQKTRVFALMGDGEQQKGQISEARRFACKYRLGNLTAIIDRNGLQICGSTQEVMPQDLAAEYKANKWNVIEIENGHDFDEIFAAFRNAVKGRVDDPGLPTAIIAHTIMGKGVSFMENRCKYHGQALSVDDAKKALSELGFDDDLSIWVAQRKENKTFSRPNSNCTVFPEINAGAPILYDPEKKTDNRSAYGAALLDLAKVNNAGGKPPRITAFSCDLEGSVKMDKFHSSYPEAFFEVGIQEHHTATLAGAMSREGFLSFFSTFGAFGVDEVYNQLRLSDINGTSLKLVCTHLGLDVGEDGPTHQCIDYVGLLNNLYEFEIFMPADPNQTDRIIRYISVTPGNHFVGMGRSKIPVITDAKGKAFFGLEYRFIPGVADWLRKGPDGCIVSYGSIIPRALAAVDLLRKEHGISVSLLNMASIKPVDRKNIIKAAKTGFIVVAEDHNVNTGLGRIVGNILAEERIDAVFKSLGVKKYSLSGKPDDLYRLEGLDSESISKTLLQICKKRTKIKRVS